ncbi:MAG TPA: aspartate kinase [Acidobacteriota bacterium]|nr:aspartate kinase [Acidobacteriota bacterium]
MNSENNIIVLKFGGTSVATSDRIRQVAELVCKKQKQGFKVVVVVSARAKMTDALIEDARSFSPHPSPREMDMLLTSGERISAAILSIAINAAGAKAISLTGSQAGIITDDDHTNARIIEIRPARVLRALNDDNIVVVSGFQGVSFKKEVTTLGRGGSDISAVALAAALGAGLCEIYSDVDGVFAADPRVVENPARIPEISYQEMQELAEAGAKVLHPKSVEFAKAKGTVIHAKSTFVPDGEGTIIRNLEGRIKPRIVGVASEDKVVLARCQDTGDAGLITRLLDALAEDNIKVKQISFSEIGNGKTSGYFIIPEKENYHIEAAIARLEAAFPGALHISRQVGAVSLVGAGINDRYDFLRRCIRLLQDHGFGPVSVHTSSFRISALVERDKVAQAVRTLYEHFLRDENEVES